MQLAAQNIAGCTLTTPGGMDLSDRQSRRCSLGSAATGNSRGCRRELDGTQAWVWAGCTHGSMHASNALTQGPDPDARAQQPVMRIRSARAHPGAALPAAAGTRSSLRTRCARCRQRRPTRARCRSRASGPGSGACRRSRSRPSAGCARRTSARCRRARARSQGPAVRAGEPLTRAGARVTRPQRPRRRAALGGLSQEGAERAAGTSRPLFGSPPRARGAPALPGG